MGRLYTIYPTVARALGLAAFRPIARASKGILHTSGKGWFNNSLGLVEGVGRM